MTLKVGDKGELQICEIPHIFSKSSANVPQNVHQIFAKLSSNVRKNLWLFSPNIHEAVANHSPGSTSVAYVNCSLLFTKLSPSTPENGEQLGKFWGKQSKVFANVWWQFGEDLVNFWQKRSPNIHEIIAIYSPSSCQTISNSPIDRHFRQLVTRCLLNDLKTITHSSPNDLRIR